MKTGKPKIALASDHGGWELKEQLKRHLTREAYELQDFGCPDNKSCDYPDFGVKAAESVASGQNDAAIIVCTTGIGMSITANKVPGVRAALCSTVEIAKLSRQHNDANVLVFGARNLQDEPIEIMEAWLHAEFMAGRHARRIGKIKSIEEKYYSPRLG